MNICVITFRPYVDKVHLTSSIIPYKFRVHSVCMCFNIKICIFYVIGKHLVLVTDLEKGSNEFAFDNPGFKGKYVFRLINVTTKVLF